MASSLPNRNIRLALHRALLRWMPNTKHSPDPSPSHQNPSRYKPPASPCPHPLHAEAELLNEANEPIKLAGGLNRLADRLTPVGWMCCVDRMVFIGGRGQGPFSCQVGPHQYKKVKGRGRWRGGDDEPDLWQPCRWCHVVNRYQETLSFLDRTIRVAAGDGRGVGKALDGLPDGALHEHWVHYRELALHREEEGLRLLRDVNAVEPGVALRACAVFVERFWAEAERDHGFVSAAEHRHAYKQWDVSGGYNPALALPRGPGEVLDWRHRRGPVDDDLVVVVDDSDEEQLVTNDSTTVQKNCDQDAGEENGPPWYGLDKVKAWLDS
ncbi:hypothetical protein B0T19DRAFT_461381 [Cercophora scortea]|uniref:Uncharacterized protein n=1 Tax=Cercophora scortea TaxID=314031 RepID=A0AAE0IN48_9PEZI|nr:hypothetical protein B0T19DRAFT_461381 [Cercophora scortea]